MNATDFRLPDQDGTIHTLSQYKGTWVILYFYPKDDTLGCTKEACNFRDTREEFTALGVVILGVSKDSVASHKKFSQKYHLNFSLLSDESLTTMKAYHAWGKKKFLGREYSGTLRMTYLINPEGNIVKTYEKVNPLEHAKEMLSDLKALQSKL